MLFYSPHANFQVICSRTLIKRHAVTGDEIDRVPAIWANFGKLGPTYQYANEETGELQTGAEIIGHYYDTDLEAVQNNWEPEIKEMVETKLQRLCQSQPERIRQIEREVVSAQAPWPTYDDMKAEEVVELASRLGKVAETILYERENAQRPYVLDALDASADAEAELAVESAPVVEEKPGKRGSTITI